MNINQKIENHTGRSSLNSQPQHTVFIINNKGIVDTWNESSEIIFGYRQDQVIGKHCGMFIDPKEVERLIGQASNSGSVAHNVQLTTQNKLCLSSTVSLSPMQNKQDQVIGFLVTITNLLNINTVEGQSADIKNSNVLSNMAECEEQLKNLKKEFDLFSYSMSHDLNAPIRAIGGYMQLLEETVKSTDPEVNDYIIHIQENIKKMSDLVVNLLSLSRIATRELKFSEINIHELVTDVLTELKNKYSYNPKIIVQNLHPVVADYALMNLVFYHLASNAIKFSSKTKNPLIEIFSEQINDKITYTIKDNGIGLELEKADKLFLAAQKLHNFNDIEGTGMGLMIVKRIIDKHNGFVGVESEPGKGTTFYFSIPINKDIN